MTTLREAVRAMQLVTLFVSLITAVVAVLVLLDVLSAFALGVMIVITAAIVLGQLVRDIAVLSET